MRACVSVAFCHDTSLICVRHRFQNKRLIRQVQ